LHEQVVTLIAAEMDRVHMSQTELAKRMGLTLKHVNRILQGHAEPSMASLDYMCFILNMDLVVIATERNNNG
jgi:transcriptional regulator with XRE-family HTH domain